MAKRSKPENLSPEQEGAELREEIVGILVGLARKRGRSSARAVELLGRLRQFDWFTRPEPNLKSEAIDAATAKRIADLAEELLGPCPNCGFRADQTGHPPDCPCAECRQRRSYLRLQDAQLQPQREPVDVGQCRILEGADD